jgi:hypothetical protein
VIFSGDFHCALADARICGQIVELGVLENGLFEYEINFKIFRISKNREFLGKLVLVSSSNSFKVS